MFNILTTKLRPRNISRTEQGFTLIELLVTVIIIGVLSAIALPSYLNQTAKVRGSEAKSTLGQLNRAQQAYRFQHGVFANALSSLDAKVTEGVYAYGLAGPVDATFVAMKAEPAPGGQFTNDLKAYGSGAYQTASGTSFAHLICQTIENSLIAPTVTLANVISTADNPCPTNSNTVE